MIYDEGRQFSAALIDLIGRKIWVPDCMVPIEVTYYYKLPTQLLDQVVEMIGVDGRDWVINVKDYNSVSSQQEFNCLGFHDAVWNCGQSEVVELYAVL